MKGNMMRNGLKNIIFLVWAFMIAQVLFAVPAYAQVAADSAGLFDNGILQGMHLLMTATYKTMGNVLMVGHALMCYAIDVDKTSVFGLIDVPNIGLLFVGLAIYVVGIFMSLSVGMYFVDASLRLGVAIIFMPISIALWPFPPTSNKFADNLGTIIRNSMLFMLMSVGVAFAVCLIDAGLFEGGDQAFWYAIDQEQTEIISENFSLFSSHILVVGFSLVFGFRILESSVNDYLNAFFSDAMFGSSSPINQMGTQAFAMAAQNVAQPAMEFAKDVATHQAGRAIGGMGSLISAEGREKIADGWEGVKRVMANPRQYYNDAMHNAGRRANEAVQNLGEKTNNAIQMAGDGVKTMADYGSAIMPIPYTEEERQSFLNGKLENGRRSDTKGFRFNQKVDRITKKLGDAAQRGIERIAPAVGQAAEDVVAHGGGAAKEAGKTAVAASIAAFSDKSTEEVRADLHETKENVKEKAGVAADAVSSAAKAAKEKVTQTEFAQGFSEGLREPDQAPVTLNPSDVIATPFKKMAHPVDTVKQMARMPKATKDAINALQDNKGQRVRFIAKKTGQIVARTGKDMGKTADATGQILKDFGNWLGDNSNRKTDNRSWMEKWQKIVQDDQDYELAKAEAQEENREMDVGDR